MSVSPVGVQIRLQGITRALPPTREGTDIGSDERCLHVEEAPRKGVRPVR